MRRIQPIHSLLALSLALGCGDDAAPDQPDAMVAPADAATIGGHYDDPSDFDRQGCTNAVALDSIDVAGIWHLDLSFPDFGRFVGAMRVDSAGGGYEGLLLGAPADQVTVDSESIFLRRAWHSEQSGYDRVYALLLCAVQSDGTVTGQFASCRDSECFIAEVTAGKVDPLPGPQSSGLTLVGQFNGTAGDWADQSITANVRVRGDFAYVARFYDGLRIVDISNPSAPVARGHAPTLDQVPEIFNDVKLIEGSDQKLYAIVASDVRGALVLDVSDPDNPTEVTQFPQDQIPVDVHTLFIDGTRAYLANTTVGGLDIFEVADPTNPVFLGRWIHPELELRGGYLHDLFVENGRVYLNYWNLGMVIVDTLADPTNAQVVGTFDSYARRTSHSNWVTRVNGRTVSVHGDEDYGAHVRIVDVDPNSVAFLDVLSEFQTRPQVSVHNILAAGNLAFVTYYQDGLRVLDLSNLLNPTEIAHFHSWPGPLPGYGSSFYEGAIGVDYDPASRTVYLADTHQGLFILTLDP